METKAIVSRIEGKEIWVIPVIEGMCINCERTGSCGQRGRPYRVGNGKGLPITVGTTVTVGASGGARFRQSLFALVFPLVCAATLLLVSDPLFRSLGRSGAGEGMKVLMTLGGLLGAGGIVMLAGAFTPNKGASEIMTVVPEKALTISY